MKSTISFLLALSLCVFLAPGAHGADLSLSASSAIVMDATSGRVLYEADAYEIRSIASITKLMTALVAVVHCEDILDDPIEIQQEWTGAEGSSVYLKAGETWTLRELLYALLLASGNDAAEAIAYACGGDMETFVGWMNEMATDLEMTQSHFTNPSGLEGEGHYSTAYDMARLACAVLTHDTLTEITATWSTTVVGRTLTNHNKLLKNYDGCIGLKTGYTTVAGRTLISAAEVDGKTLVAVTLKAPNDWQDHKILLDYAFGQFDEGELVPAGTVVATIPVTGSLCHFVNVVTGEDFYYPLQEGECLVAQPSLPTAVSAPISQGTVVGSISYALEGVQVGTTSLVYETATQCHVVEPLSLFEKIVDWFR